MRILGIETSCDETAIAVIDVRGQLPRPRAPTPKSLVWGRVRILSNVIASQVKLHAKFGGVVPHLAKREHQKNLIPVLLAALREAGLIRHPGGTKRQKDPRDPSLALRMTAVGRILERESDLFARMIPKALSLRTPEIDAIAVTVGPGLAPALWVGVNFARALAYLWGKPLIPVNHLEGHIYTNLIPQQALNPKFEARNPKQMTPSVILSPAESGTKDLRGFLRRFAPQDDRAAVGLEFRISGFEFPAIALLVSGGHTELVLMSGCGRYRVIGETLDDASGEAFDKVAKMLGLGFPGGPIISRLAERGNPRAFSFPRPMMHSKDFNFSFSGLKTAVLYTLRGKISSTNGESVANKRIRKFGTDSLFADISASFQQAVVDVLVFKTVRAAKQFAVKTVMVGGGVAANKKLRHELGTALKKALPGTRYLVPDTRLTGDNALMIALAGWFNRGKKTSWQSVGAEANLRLDTQHR